MGEKSTGVYRILKDLANKRANRTTAERSREGERERKRERERERDGQRERENTARRCRLEGKAFCADWHKQRQDI